MYKNIIKAVWGLALAAVALLPATASAQTLKLHVSSAWRDTGLKVTAGEKVTAQVDAYLRYWDALSVNSNGEWLYCPNKNASAGAGSTQTLGAKGNAARMDAARPMPGAPGGALIFRIGNGQPFFAPRDSGVPGKDFTTELGLNGYTKLPGYFGKYVTHRFVAPESGVLYVSINLSEKAKVETYAGNLAWNWPVYNIKFVGRALTANQVSGVIVDQAGFSIPDAQVQMGDMKTLSGADGAFSFAGPKDGMYNLIASKPGYTGVAAPVKVSLAAGGLTDVGNVVLRVLPSSISGKVITEDGRPAANALVTIGNSSFYTTQTGIFSRTVTNGVYSVSVAKLLSNGLQGSAIKENVEVLPGRNVDVGQMVLTQNISPGTVWLSANRAVTKGQTLVLRAGGELAKGAQKFGPAGLPGKPAGAGAFMPSAEWGSLVAKIGAGKPFLVGTEARVRASDSGILYFAVNLPPAEAKGVTGRFFFTELTLLNLGDITGVITGADGRPLTMASVGISGLDEQVNTDTNGAFLIKDLPAYKQYLVQVKFPGYNTASRYVVPPLAAAASIGKVTLTPAPVMGTVSIKLLPKSGSTGGLIPVFVEVVNTSSPGGLWGGYLVSLKAKHLATGKEYPGMSPTYMVLSPGEKKGAELICQLPAAAPAGEYYVIAELRVPETVSIQDAAKQFDAKKQLEDKLAAMNTLTGRSAAQDIKRLNVVSGIDDAKVAQAVQSAKLLVPTITPKVFSPSKGQIVTGTIALREKSVIVLGKEMEIFKDKNGAPLLIWNSYEGLYLSSREDGARKNDWVWIGQSNVQSDDFSVNWDTSKFEDGDYLIRATMKTVYDGKPIEGSMEVMVKVRNDPRTGLITGRVVDENGQPLPNVDVKRLARGQAINGLDWESMGTKSSVEWQAEDVVKTNARGEYTLTGMMSGDHKLQFLLEKYSAGAREVSLKPAQMVNVPPVVLEAEKCKLTGAFGQDDGGNTAGARVSLAGPTALAAAADGGKYSFEGLKIGSYQLTVSKDGYEPVYSAFTCAPGEAKTLPGLLLRRMLFQVTGRAFDAAGKGLAGVTVTLDKGGAGTVTGEEGKFNIYNVPGGSHEASFAKAGWQSAAVKFTAAASSGPARVSYVEAALAPLKGRLAVTLEPASAQLLVNGAAVALSGNKYEAELAIGEYSVQARKEGFDAFERKVSVGASENVALEIKLAKTKGTMALTVEPASSEVVIDGAVVKLHGNKYEAAMEPGEHVVKVSKDKFDTFEETLTVPAGGQLARDIKLANSKGRLSASVEPADAEFLLDGAAVQLNGGKFEAALAPGEHTLAAAKEMFEPYSGKVTVKSGETETLEIKLADGYDRNGYNKNGFDREGYDKAGFNAAGFDKAGFDKAGFNASGYDKDGYDKAGFNKDGYDKSGYNKEGFDKAGFDKAGFNASGYDKDGYDKAGFDNAGFDKSGYDKAGFDKSGFDKAGYDKDGHDKTGFNKAGFDRSGFDKAGFDKDGYDKSGFDKSGFDKAGYDKDGYDKAGFNKEGYDKTGFNKSGYDRNGYDKSGFDKDGYNQAGFDKAGFDKAGYDKDGYDKAGFNKEGYDKTGFNKSGFDRGGWDKSGYDKDGYDKSGFNKAGFNRAGYDKAGFDKDGYNQAGFDKSGFDKTGYDKDGYDKAGYDKAGFNKAGFDKSGYDKTGYDKDGYDKAGLSKSGFDKSGFNKAGYDKDGYDKSGFNAAGFDRGGLDKSGYDKDGYDKAGYNKAGFDRAGYDKAGFDRDGFDKTGYDKAGYDKAGYNKAGFDKSGYDKAGFDKDGYGKAGFNKEGFDRNGYNQAGFDKAGFDKSGYDKDGYDKAGFNKSGFDRAGYDKAGFNKAGFDRGGRDVSGYDKDGYDKNGFDKAGFNRAGYDKTGFNKAGFNAAGLDRAGKPKVVKPELALAADTSQTDIGAFVTLNVQTPDPDTEIELSAENGVFETSDQNAVFARTDAKGKYQARWVSLTPAKHRITLKAGKGGAVGVKYAEVTLANQVPEVDAVLRTVRGSLAVGGNLVVEAQIKNNGKVSGKYRIEAEVRGRTGYPVVPLKPMELQLASGQTKIAKYDWTVGAIGEYVARLRIYLVGDRGRLQLVKTYEASLTYTKPVPLVKK